MAASVEFSALRAQTLGAGDDEEAVTVNTRALIDKVLARYSGEWTVLRELLQNAADASATKVTIRLDTLPSSTVPLPQSTESSAFLKHTLLHHTLKRLLVSNNGHPFGPNDWLRLKRIAEGNPDETKIGAFGVGFYSVFDTTEEPFVQSGREAMAFYWKGNSLFTRKLQLTEAQARPDTTFVLDYRDTTSAVPSILSLSQFLASSLTFVGLTDIELWLDDWKMLSLNKLIAPAIDVVMPKSLDRKTPEGLMRVEAVVQETAQLSARWLKAVGWKPKAPSSFSSMAKDVPPTQSLRTFFSRFSNPQGKNAAIETTAIEEKEAQMAISANLLADCSKTVFMQVNTATISTNVSKAFALELERATKKPPPKSTKIAVLTASFDGSDASLAGGNKATEATDIFSSVLPSKSGRIFIGQITHQTSGLFAHISVQSAIPTVERENIDLNARWVRTWNQELLRACGIVCRISWTGEINSVRDRLSQSMSKAGRTKISKEDVEKALPEAIHVLNTFTFRESTPSSLVGSLLEEAFWTCNKASSIEILSSRGILNSQNVRIGTDELSFVDSLPIVPAALFDKAPGFVKKLIDFGLITDVTISDIQKELETKALDSKQLLEFLQWLAHKVRLHEVEDPSRLLDVTVANDDDAGKPIVLSEVKHFINPSKIPASLPFPPSTIPFKFTKNIERSELEALGWSSLDIVPWVRWLTERTDSTLPPEQDMFHSPSFAGQVLSIISKQFDGLSQSSKAAVIDILKNRTVIPTKFGLRKPTESYFPSVRLFEDLPVVTVNGVKEKFLSSLGVRKTIALNLVFDRLLKTDKTLTSGSWNHVDLVKYLASVRADIPKDDINRLKNTAICPAEGTKAPTALHRLSDLFEPNDDLRALGLPILQWPSVYRSGSDEGKFLRSLGLRTYPTASEIIAVIAQAQNNSPLQTKALRYLVDFHHQNGYSSREISSTNIAFLPVEGKPGLARPLDVYTNENVTMMNLQMLRKDLRKEAPKLGVQEHPPIDDAVLWLVKNPPGSHRYARTVFDYFASRLSEIHGETAEVIANAYIVPGPSHLPVSKEWSTHQSAAIRYLRPADCFLGSGGKYSDIFDYVDFGPPANALLLRCGAKNEPSLSEIAWLVVREPTRVFSTFSSTEKYLGLLAQLALDWTTIKKDKALVKEMKRAPFLLAFKEIPPAYTSGSRQAKGNDAEFYNEDEEAAVKTYQLVSVDQVTIIDDMINYSVFRDSLLAAPMDETLESFYASLGVVPLSNLVEEKPKIGREVEDQRPASNLRRLVQERIKLFFHDVSKDLIKRDAVWLENNLNFAVVQSLSVRKSLRGQNISHTESTSAITTRHPERGLTLFLTASGRDLFQVSSALLPWLLHRSKPQHAMLLMTLLETDLHRLRQRGYPVERILRKKAMEARLAEQRREQQLEEEQRRIDEAARDQHNSKSAAIKSGIKSEPSMPGVFPESPDQTNRSSKTLRSLLPSTNDHDADKKSIWSQLTGRFGGEAGRKAQIQAPEPENGSEALVKRPTVTQGKPITAPHQLQENLLSAIKACRPHNSQSVINPPTVNDVTETSTFCDAKPAQNIKFVAEANGLKVFLSNDISESNKFMEKNASALSAFASVLLDVAGALALSRKSLHMFYDESGTIAFNTNGALFFNYRFFESLHFPDVQSGKSGDALIYWFVVCAHELSHNMVADHSAAHSYYTESFVAQYFKTVALKVAKAETSKPVSDQHLLDMD